MTERDRLEANAAVILAGLLQSPNYAASLASELADHAVTLASIIRTTVRDRHPHAWEKEEADVPV